MRELLSHHSGAKHATAVFAPVSFLRPFRFCMEKRSFVKTGSVQALAGQLKQNGVCLHAGLPRLPGNLHGTPQNQFTNYSQVCESGSLEPFTHKCTDLFTKTGSGQT
jgi:hypothetical protein